MPVADAVLFDLDGTLVDSRVVVERHWGRMAREHGLDLAGILAVCHGRRTRDTIREVAPHLDADAIGAALDAAEEADVDGLVPVPGALELVGSLPADRWAVVTSGHRALATRRLAAVGIPEPAVLICGDEIAAGKPDPEGFRRAAERLGAHPEACVVVEDAPAGVAAGVALGAVVVALTTTHAPDALLDADALAPDLRSFRETLAGLGIELGATA